MLSFDVDSLIGSDLTLLLLDLLPRDVLDDPVDDFFLFVFVGTAG